MDSNDKYIGKRLDNRYEILEKIGSGGMAVVYKARDHRLNRLVAVKILKEELAGDEEFRRRFRTESQAVAMLSHANIVSVYDVSRSGDTEYIVMELIEGITLKQYMNRKSVLNWKETLHFTIQIAKALGHAHSRGIIHRDIKPHNIMILKDGSVKVADFGIARLVFNQNTLTQETLGSVHYISPEQAKGANVDTRTDLYSLGVVMYEMLTSRLPFVGDSPVSVAIQHISAIPLMPREINPDIPAGLEDITMHAMEAKLDNRYASADEMLRDLEEFRKDPTVRFPYGNNGVDLPNDEQMNSTRPVPAEAVNDTEKAMVPAKPVAPAKKGSKEMTRDEYRRTKRKASSTSTLIGIFCIVVVVILLVAFMWHYFLKDMIAPSEEMVTIPRLIGQMYSSVTSNAEYAQYYRFDDVSYEYDDTYPEGMIINQNPQPDRQQTAMSNGINISLTVSLGKQPDEEMPYIIGRDYREAKIMLEKMGLDLEINLIPEASDDVTEGYVMEQMPASGESLIEGGSVYVTYSTGPEIEYTSVPNVVGLKLSAAITRLESYDLTYKSEEVFDEEEAGTVIFQSYEKDAKVPVHTEIALQVSKGPEIKKVDMPDLVGKTVDDAREIINGLNMGVSIQYARENNDAPENEVINQQPSAGRTLTEGDTVYITYSAGPAKVEPDTKPDTETDTGNEGGDTGPETGDGTGGGTGENTGDNTGDTGGTGNTETP